MKTLVLGLGNPLRGDDGVGAAVIEQLAALDSLSPDVDILEGGTPGLETVLLLDGYQQAMIVDAAEMGLDPGEWRRCLYGEVALTGQDDGLGGTLHNAGLAEALQLGEALGILPEQTIIYAVQPDNVGWESGLSTAVVDVIPAIVNEIRKEIQPTNYTD